VQVQATPLRRPIRLRNTAGQAWRNCRRLFRFEWLEGWRQKGLPAPALLLGQMVHKGLEAHHRDGTGQAAVLAFAQSLAEPSATQRDQDGLSTAHSLAQAILAGYSRRWADDPAPDAQLLEQQAEVRLPSGDFLTGTIDRLVRTGSDWWLWEHKTTSDYSQNYFDQAAVSWQVCGYMLLARKLVGEWPKGIVYNTILKSALVQSTSESREEYFQRVARQYIGQPYGVVAKKTPAAIAAAEASARETAHRMFTRTEILLSKRHLKDFTDQIQFMLEEIRSAVHSGNPAAFYPNTGYCYRARQRCQFLDTCAAYESSPNPAWFEIRKEEIVHV
jgi:PD-(D/E)XK nuclease superfamily protein